MRHCRRPPPSWSPCLADAVAYRRDRRKDLLLQENGYRVLRFLAEDVGKELDSVLDTILRTLVQSQRRLS